MGAVADWSKALMLREKTYENQKIQGLGKKFIVKFETVAKHCYVNVDSHVLISLLGVG